MGTVWSVVVITGGSLEERESCGKHARDEDGTKLNFSTSVFFFENSQSSTILKNSF